MSAASSVGIGWIRQHLGRSLQALGELEPLDRLTGAAAREATRYYPASKCFSRARRFLRAETLRARSAGVHLASSAARWFALPKLRDLQLAREPAAATERLDLGKGPEATPELSCPFDASG